MTNPTNALSNGASQTVEPGGTGQRVDQPSDADHPACAHAGMVLAKVEDLARRPEPIPVADELARSGLWGRIRSGAYMAESGLSLDEWELDGEILAWFARRTPFLIGDWANAGRALFGWERDDAVDHVVQLTGLAERTVSNSMYVASRITADLRRPESDLSGRHYYVVAPVAEIDQALAKELLDKAEQDGLDSDTFREIVKPIKQRLQQEGRLRKSFDAAELDQPRIAYGLHRDKCPTCTCPKDVGA